MLKYQDKQNKKLLQKVGKEEEISPLISQFCMWILMSKTSHEDFPLLNNKNNTSTFFIFISSI